MSWTQQRGSLGRLVFLCMVIGAIAGFGAIGFYVLLESCSYFFLEYCAGVHLRGPAGEPPLFAAMHVNRPSWLLIVVPWS